MKMREDNAGGRTWHLTRNDDGLWLSCEDVHIMLDAQNPATLEAADEILDALKEMTDYAHRFWTSSILAGKTVTAESMVRPLSRARAMIAKAGRKEKQR